MAFYDKVRDGIRPDGRGGFSDFDVEVTQADRDEAKTTDTTRIDKYLRAEALRALTSKGLSGTAALTSKANMSVLSGDPFSIRAGAPR